MKRISTTGFVFGNCWGGGTCGYNARHINGTVLKEVKATALNMLEDGSLDSGMGYESLYGAILKAKIEDIRIINGREFVCTRYKVFSVGKLSRQEREHIKTH